MNVVRIDEDSCFGWGVLFPLMSQRKWCTYHYLAIGNEGADTTVSNLGNGDCLGRSKGRAVLDGNFRKLMSKLVVSGWKCLVVGHKNINVYYVSRSMDWVSGKR